MFFILRSALAFFFGKLFQAAILKFVIFGGIAVFASELLPIIVDKLMPTTDGLTSALGGIDDTFYFYADTFMLFQGISVCLSAMSTRFIIRRIPFFG